MNHAAYLQGTIDGLTSRIEEADARAKRAEADVEKWRVAYRSLSDRLRQTETTLNEVGRLVTNATEYGDRFDLDALVAVLDRYVRGADLPPWKPPQADGSYKPTGIATNVTKQELAEDDDDD